MTRLKELQSLLAKVEAGDRNALFADFFILDEIAGTLDQTAVAATKAQYGSLDGALTAHEALVPEWIWDLGPENDAGQITACVCLKADQSVQSCAAAYNNPARAWLIAIIKALIAKEKDE